jgi:hypothetical protein
MFSCSSNLFLQVFHIVDLTVQAIKWQAHFDLQLRHYVGSESWLCLKLCYSELVFQPTFTESMSMITISTTYRNRANHSRRNSSGIDLSTKMLSLSPLF